ECVNRKQRARIRENAVERIRQGRSDPGADDGERGSRGRTHRDRHPVEHGTQAAFVQGLRRAVRSEEHTSELQSRENLVCRLLLDTPTTAIYTLSLHDALPI